MGLFIRSLLCFVVYIPRLTHIHFIYMYISYPESPCVDDYLNGREWKKTSLFWSSDLFQKYCLMVGLTYSGRARWLESKHFLTQIKQWPSTKRSPAESCWVEWLYYFSIFGHIVCWLYLGKKHQDQCFQKTQKETTNRKNATQPWYLHIHPKMKGKSSSVSFVHVGAHLKNYGARFFLIHFP